MELGVNLGDMIAPLLNVSGFLMVSILFSLALGDFVFGPMRIVDPRLQMGVQFRIFDLLTLAVQLQFVAGAIFAAAPDSPVDRLSVGRLSLTVFLCLLFGTWWWAGVRLLRYGGINDPIRRFWFLAVLVPFGFTVAMLLMWLPVGALTALMLIFIACNFGQWELLWYVPPVISVALLHIALTFICRSACASLVSPAVANRQAGRKNMGLRQAST